MAGIVITDAGISLKSYQELREELKQAWVAVFGDRIDLSPTSIDGHHIDLECKTITSVSQLLEAVISNFDVHKAGGVWLDILGDYKSMERIRASYSKASVKFSGQQGVEVPAGTIVRYEGSPCNFVLSDSVTIGSDGTAVGICVATIIGKVEIYVGEWKMVSSTPANVTCSVDTPAGTGRDDETDAEFRVRQKNYGGQGLATLDKMYSYIASAIGTGNFSLRQNVEDVEKDGLPPHRFEVIVNNSVGTDDEIAQVIWNCKPGGIKGYGTSSGKAVDASGYTQEVMLSRTSTLRLWVKVSITEYTEEVLPADYTRRIAEEIDMFAMDEYAPGKDVIPKRLYGPVYAVGGILDVDVFVCVSATEPQPSDYTDEVIHVPASSKVEVAGISVELDS